MTLMNQVVDDGYRIVGPTREVYVEAAPELPQSEWVTELIVPVEKA